MQSKLDARIASIEERIATLPMLLEARHKLQQESKRVEVACAGSEGATGGGGDATDGDSDDVNTALSCGANSNSTEQVPSHVVQQQQQQQQQQQSQPQPLQWGEMENRLAALENTVKQLSQQLVQTTQPNLSAVSVTAPANNTNDASTPAEPTLAQSDPASPL